MKLTQGLICLSILNGVWLGKDPTHPLALSEGSVSGGLNPAGSRSAGSTKPWRVCVGVGEGHTQPKLDVHASQKDGKNMTD